MAAIKTINNNNCSLYIKLLTYVYSIAVNTCFTNFTYDLPLLVILNTLGAT